MSIKIAHPLQRKSVKSVFAVMIAFAFVVPALAHPRRWHHVHRRPVVVVRAPALVVGVPCPARRVVYVGGRVGAVVDFNIKPRATRIYVDGSLRGTADDFDGFPGKMHLRPGEHDFRLVTPEGRVVRERVSLQGGTEIDLRLDLR